MTTRMTRFYVSNLTAFENASGCEGAAETILLHVDVSSEYGGHLDGPAIFSECMSPEDLKTYQKASAIVIDDETYLALARAANQEHAAQVEKASAA